jgi:hypothetical protein
MKKFTKDNFNIEEALNELMLGSGVIVFNNVYNLDDIKSAREIVNHSADTQDQKESHFNAEAEASGKINLQQRVWNLFGKGKVFSKLITDDLIFILMSKLLGNEFFCGSYCASRLLPGSPWARITYRLSVLGFLQSRDFPNGVKQFFCTKLSSYDPLR